MSRIEPRTVKELAALVDGRVCGIGDEIITSVASLSEAQEGALSFYGSSAFQQQLASTKASCLLVRSSDIDAVPSPSCIVVDNPYAAFVTILRDLIQEPRMAAGLRAHTSTISASARVHETASIGPGCVIGDDCVIDDHVQLVANVVAYAGTKIGRNTLVHANVTMYAQTQIGQDCIIHSGAVIGSDGFGYIEHPDHTYTKIPQVGNVVIGNNVEVGANTTIDRAALGSTVIHDGVKIDNLVQIAHGVVIGEHTALAAQAGVSGSTVIGKRSRMAGQVGVAGHISIADDVVVMGQSGVTKSLMDPGVYSGTPAQPHHKQLRNDAALRGIMDMQQRLQELENNLAGRDSREENL